MSSSVESLQCVAPGSRDIIVGVSGFGSAWMDGERWRTLHDMTGWSLYTLRYSSQVLPRMETGPLDYLARLYVRFRAAELAAQSASDYLAQWVNRWHGQGRRVMLAGFSLGGHVVYRAAQKAPGCTVLTVASAHPSSMKHLAGLESSSVCHLYSRDDSVLKILFPLAGKESATGTAPLPKGIGALNVDITDIVGSDHIKTADMVPELMTLGLECLLGADVTLFGAAPPGGGSLSPLDGKLRRFLEGVVPQDRLWGKWAEEGCEGRCGAARLWVPKAARWALDRQPELLDLSKKYRALKDMEGGARERLAVLGRGRLWALRDGVAPSMSFSSLPSSSSGAQGHSAQSQVDLSLDLSPVAPGYSGDLQLSEG